MKVLFICVGNVARSQEAAAFYNQMTRSHDARSAGTHAVNGKPIDPLVVAVMAEAGINMDSAARKSVTSQMVQEADVVVSFVPKVDIEWFEIADAEFWDVGDPRWTSLEEHRVTRDLIKGLVEGFIARHR